MIEVPVKHGKANNEINPIERGTHSVCLISVFKWIAWKHADRKCLHESSKVGKYEYGGPKEQCSE